MMAPHLLLINLSILRSNKKNDKIKRDYANKNNYNLLEIWYYDFDNIENIMNKFIYDLKNPVTTIAV